MNIHCYTLTFLSMTYILSYTADGRTDKADSDRISILTDRSLPHFDEQRTDKQTGQLVRPTLVVFNYSLHPETEESINSLDRAKVSAHFVIGQDGNTHQLVNPEHRAWHAGHARFRLGEHLRTDINSHSIGIIVANRGLTILPEDASAQRIEGDSVHILGSETDTFEYPCTREQIAAIIGLIAHLQAQDYDLKTYTSHAEVATSPKGVAGRKIGPGPLFPWKELAENGIGIWPTPDESKLPEIEDERIKEAQTFLNLQHDCPATGVIDAHTRALLISFQMHFTPDNITGKADDTTLHAMRGLRSQIEKIQESYKTE